MIGPIIPFITQSIFCVLRNGKIHTGLPVHLKYISMDANSVMGQTQRPVETRPRAESGSEILGRRQSVPSARGSLEHCKRPQRGLGQSLRKSRFSAFWDLRNHVRMDSQLLNLGGTCTSCPKIEPAQQFPCRPITQSTECLVIINLSYLKDLSARIIHTQCFCCIGLSQYIAITNLPIIAVFVEYLHQFLIDLHQTYRHSSVPKNTSP